MSISLIPFWVTLLWALIFTVFWRLKIKEPLNHWLICGLVFAVNLFWFAYSCVIFLLIAVVKLLGKKDESKKEDESKQ